MSNVKPDELLEYLVFGYLLGSGEFRTGFRPEMLTVKYLRDSLETIKRYDSGDEDVKEDEAANYKIENLCSHLGVAKEKQQHLPDACLQQVVKNGTTRRLRDLGRDILNAIKVDEKIPEFERRLSELKSDPE